MQVGPGPGNHTLTVRTINVGLTLLAVQVRGVAGVADFVPIPVEQAIHPAEAQRLVVGDVVCFSVQFTSPDGEASTCCHTLAHTHTHLVELCLTSQLPRTCILSNDVKYKRAQCRNLHRSNRDQDIIETRRSRD